MFLRNFYRLRLASARCSLQAYPRVSLGAQFSSVAVKNESVDKFNDLIDDLVTTSAPLRAFTSSYAQKLRGAKTIEEFQKLMSTDRPTKAEEVVFALHTLEHLSAVSPKQASEFLKSEVFVTALAAQLLTPDVALENLVEVLACILRINHGIPIEEEGVANDSVKLSHTLASFFSKLCAQVEAGLQAKTEDLNATTAINFYCDVKPYFSKLSPGLKEITETSVLRKISEVHTSSSIIRLLQSLNGKEFNDMKFNTPILAKVEELVPIMLNGERISVMATLAAHKCRKYELLQSIAEGIRSYTDILTCSQIVRLSNAIVELSFYHQRLVSRICQDLLNSTSSIRQWGHVTSIINLLAKARVTDEKIWLAIIEWMRQHLKNAPYSDLRFCFSALVGSGLPPKHFADISATVAKKLQPGTKEQPKRWLNIVWSLAVVDALSPKLAESVLCEDFKKEVLSSVVSTERTFIAQKLLQISSAATHGIPNYRGSTVQKFDNDVNTSVQSFRQLKYGKNLAFADQFMTYLSVIIPGGCASQVDQSVGALIDALYIFDSSTNKLASLNSVLSDPLKPLAGKNVVLYFNDNHFSRGFTDEDDGKRRLLGVYQMNVRHLKASGASVVVVTEHELQQCSDSVSRLKLIKEKLITPSKWVDGDVLL
uniref:RAP domain-containing protein n=1 Tax=Panagrellus redivivus TaxID=6233 RepID=A0A7E4W5J8_PANRE